MRFRKFQPKVVFDGFRFLSPGKVLITDEAGKIEEIADEADAGGDIQKMDGILSPGFVNCHCHLELSHMRGLIPEKTGLVDFVFSVVTQRHFPEEEILEAIKNGEEEMIANGIVAVGDICNNLLTLGQKEKNNLHYYNFIESSGWLPAIAPQRFERSRFYFDNYKAVSPCSIVPHAPYSVSSELWELIKPFFQDKVVSIHNQETSFEDELFIQNSGDFVRMYEMMKLDTSFFSPSGKSSLQTYFRQLDNASRVVLVHNTFTRQADIDYITATRESNTVAFCLCINANQYIEGAVPPIEMLRQNNCKIVLGTDSLASNHSLSIVDEMITIQQYFRHIPTEEMLKWATMNGAEALEMDTQIGSFEQGKKPGVVLLHGLKAEDKYDLQNVVIEKLL